MEYSLKNKVELVPCGAHEPSIATKGAGEGAGAGPEQVGVMYCNVSDLVARERDHAPPPRGKRPLRTPP